MKVTKQILKFPWTSSSKHKMLIKICQHSSNLIKFAKLPKSGQFSPQVKQSLTNLTKLNVKFVQNSRNVAKMLSISVMVTNNGFENYYVYSIFTALSVPKEARSEGRPEQSSRIDLDHPIHAGAGPSHPSFPNHALRHVWLDTTKVVGTSVVR